MPDPGPASPALLEVDDITVRYGPRIAVDRVSLALRPGLIGALVGPSGCGKTTLLRAVAGFVEVSAGRIRLNGKRVSDPQGTVPPEQRRVGMVFQDLALFPHLDVTGNIGFGLRSDARAWRERRVAELLELMGLAEYRDTYPHQLSGGQQQRVAIARAMAPKPMLLLLDEPFSSLDPELREQLPRELRDIFRQDGMTALLVTHDQQEAFAMADEIGVMRDARLEQWDTAYNLYHKPATRFVAGFVGEGVRIPGTLLDERTVLTELGELCGTMPPGFRPGQVVEVLLRPDDVVHDDGSPLRAQVLDRTFRGAEFLYHLALESGSRLLCLAASHHNHAPGDAIGVRPELDHLVLFAQDTGASPRPPEAAVVDSTRLQR